MLHPHLPSEWVALTDPVSGKLYFANKITGQSQWEAPMMIPSLQNTNILSTQHTIGPNNHSTLSQITTTVTYDTSSTLTSAPTTLKVSQANATPTSSLITTTRAAMNQYSTSDYYIPDTIPFDYPMIATGTIVDLIHLQSDWRANQFNSLDDRTKHDFHKNCYYEPIQPFEIPLEIKDHPVELGRVEIRYMTLMNELQKMVVKN